MSGWSLVNSGSSCAITAPSRPIAHTLTRRWCGGGEPHPAAHSRGSRTVSQRGRLRLLPAVTVLARAEQAGSARVDSARVEQARADSAPADTVRADPAGWSRPERALLEPPARESGALQALAHVRIAVHDSPHQRRAIVLDHCQYRPLIDADVVPVNPARQRGLLWALRSTEAGVERVKEPVRGVDRGAEAMVHLQRRRQHDLGGEGERADGAVGRWYRHRRCGPLPRRARRTSGSGDSRPRTARGRVPGRRRRSCPTRSCRIPAIASDSRWRTGAVP